MLYHDEVIAVYSAPIAVEIRQATDRHPLQDEPVAGEITIRQVTPSGAPAFVFMQTLYGAINMVQSNNLVIRVMKQAIIQ